MQMNYSYTILIDFKIINNLIGQDISWGAPKSTIPLLNQKYSFQSIRIGIGYFFEIFYQHFILVLKSFLIEVSKVDHNVPFLCFTRNHHMLFNRLQKCPKAHQVILYCILYLVIFLHFGDRSLMGWSRWLGKISHLFRMNKKPQNAKFPFLHFLNKPTFPSNPHNTENNLLSSMS